MEIPDRHEFRLSIPGLPELREMVRSFVEQTLQFALHTLDCAGR